MDIDRVRYFNVFAEAGSLVRASAVLGISQPALSKALRALETETALKLVEPDGRGLRLTEAGKRFRDITAPLLSEWMSVPKDVRENTSVDPVRIASFEVFTTYFLGQLNDFTELTELEIHELGPGKMEQAVAEGKADLALTYAPVPRAGVDFTEVGKINMGVFGRSELSSLGFDELPFVVPLLPAEGTPSKIQGLDGWPDHRWKRKIDFRVTMMESALELCRQGVCAAYLPEFVARLHNRRLLPEFRLKELRAPLPQKERAQSVYLVTPSGSDETKLHRQLAKAIRSLA